MKLKIIGTVSIVIVFIVAILVIYDSYSYPLILEKKKEYLRIGYVNLHASPIAEKELIEFKKFNCDLWLLAEWNGNNLDLNPNFTDGYEIFFEIIDAKTYGFLVLGKKDLQLIAKKIKPNNSSYTCNYPSILLEGDDININFVHVPPPVPSCDFQTGEYINRLVHSLENEDLASNQILVGDFNLLPFQSAYKVITAAGFTDAFEEDFFLNGTFGGFSGFPNLLRIDYVFYRGKLDAGYTKRFKLTSSDHCGLITDIIVTDSTSFSN